jgi:hypothetical protein
MSARGAAVAEAMARGRDRGLFVNSRKIFTDKIILIGLPAGTLPPLRVVIQPQLFAFPAEGVAMNSQSVGCLALVSVVLLQHALDKPFLEFAYGVGKLNSLFDHAVDESF